MASKVDIPCDLQGRDRDGHLWAFLDEAAHPQAIEVGRVVITGDDDGPVAARIIDIVERPGGRKVVMERLALVDPS